MRSARDVLVFISRIPLRRRRLEIFSFHPTITKSSSVQRIWKRSLLRRAGCPAGHTAKGRPAGRRANGGHHGSGGAFPGRVRECEEVPQKRAAAAAQFRGISRARTTTRQYPCCECGCKKGAHSRAPSLRFLMPSPRAFDEAPSVITCKQVSPHPRPDSPEEPVDPGSLRFGADPRNALQRRRP